MEHLQPYMSIVDSPSKLVYTCILILIIVYSSVIPMEYKRFADSMLGRGLGIAIVYGVTMHVGWIHGLLTAIAFLLLLHGGVSVNLNEGFDGVGSISDKKTIGNRWWVEKIIGEHPSAISTDRVTTGAPGNG